MKLEHTYFRRDGNGWRWNWWFQGGFEINAEVSFGSYDGFLLSTRAYGGDSDRSLGFTFALPKLIFASLGFEPVMQEPQETRTWALGYYGDYLSLEWNHSEYFGQHRTGWRWSRSPKDVLLGHAQYAREPLTRAQVLIPLPEGTYPAEVILTKDTWKRPRWPWQRVVYRAEVTPETPLPIQGKGENEWDQGEDAIHSLCFPAKTLHEAVTGAVKSVLRSREDRGVPESVATTGGFVVSEARA